MVERRVAGTRTSAVDAEGSRRRESTSDSGWINSGMQILWRCYVHYNAKSLDAFRHTQPEQVHEQWCHMVELARISRESCLDKDTKERTPRRTLMRLCNANSLCLFVGECTVAFLACKE